VDARKFSVALQSFIARTVLLPERFRVDCAFGGGIAELFALPLSPVRRRTIARGEDVPQDFSLNIEPCIAAKSLTHCERRDLNPGYLSGMMRLIWQVSGCSDRMENPPG
jgi:hypothetical protein